MRFLLIFALLAWILRSLIVAPFSIPSGSMLPNLLIGDYLIVAKWPYGYSRYSFPFGVPAFEGRIFGDLPKRGDVVVFKLPGDEGVDFVKRVIGLPGDTIEVRGGMLILNGQRRAARARHRCRRADLGQQPVPRRRRRHPDDRQRWQGRAVLPLSRPIARRFPAGAT